MKKPRVTKLPSDDPPAVEQITAAVASGHRRPTGAASAKWVPRLLQ